MTSINYVPLIPYSGNKPTTRTVKFGHLTITIPRGVYVYRPTKNSWALSLKNLRPQFKDIKITSRTAQESRPESFETVYHQIIVALANSQGYCNANHHNAINTRFKSVIGSYEIYKKYNLPPICGICLSYASATRIRAKTKKSIAFSHAYGKAFDHMVNYVQVGPKTRELLIQTIKSHIKFKGKQWLDENANAKEFLSKF